MRLSTYVLVPTLLTKFNSTHFKNLQYSICFIAFVVASWVSSVVVIRHFVFYID
jgi:hypothetical protein